MKENLNDGRCYEFWRGNDDSGAAAKYDKIFHFWQTWDNFLIIRGTTFYNILAYFNSNLFILQVEKLQYDKQETGNILL